MWKPLIENQEQRKVLTNKLAEITDSLSLTYSSVEMPGLMNGQMGISLYFSYLSRYLNTDRFEGIVAELILGAFSPWNTPDRYQPSLSYCSGLSGILEGIRLSNEEGFIEMDENYVDTHSTFKQQIQAHANNNDFDYLHGAGGILLYLLRHSPKPGAALIPAYLKALQMHGIKKDNSICWESIINIESGQKGYNLSLSHGISGTIILLCRILDKEPDNKEARQLVIQSLNYLLSQKNNPLTHSVSLFPSISGESAASDNSRLGWCYGDLGNAMALSAAGKTLQNPAYSNLAIQILEHAAQRRGLPENRVGDAGICHGTAGIAHIFNRFYQYTQKTEFKEAALYWIRQTLDMSTHTDGLAGYKIPDGKQGWKNETSLLEGIAGIGLVLLAALDDKEPKWDRCLLLS
jgi:lantibiotic modifying enzyme